MVRFIRQNILEAYLNDTSRASILQSDGTYAFPQSAGVAVDAQQLLAARA